MDLQLQVAQAVKVLNHDPLSCNRVAANQWLVQFQHSDAAWEVAAGILTLESPHIHDFEVEVFAAQILKRKIQNDIGNLQPDSRTALQNALLVSAKKFSLGSPQLLTQICLALSALVLRTADSGTLIEELFISLAELQFQGTGSHAVLELLTVLPEEIMENQAINMSINADRRRQLSQQLLSKASAVLEFLLQLSASDNLDIHNERSKVLRCLLSWVRIGCFFEISQNSLGNHPLLDFVFGSLQVSSAFDIAVEVIVELINRHEELPQFLFPRLLTIKDRLLPLSVAGRNESIIKGFSSLMAELGQAAPCLLAEGTQEALSLTDGILQCMNFSSMNWDIAESSLPFWCTFGEYLISMEDAPAGHKRSMAIATYSPTYLALLDAIVARAQVLPQEYGEADLDVNSGLPDGLSHFRVNCEEALNTICRLLGPSQYLGQLLGGSWGSYENPNLWEAVEVRLFCFYVVVDVVLDSQPLDLSGVIQVILQTGPTVPSAGSPLVHKSAAQVIGAYSKWISSYSALLMPLLSLLASGLRTPLSASSCATALRRICEDSASILNEPANFECLIWLGEGLHELQLSSDDEEEIVFAIGGILSAVNNGALVKDALERLLQSSYRSLESILKMDGEGSLRLHSPAYAAGLESAIRALHRVGTLLGQLLLPAPSNLIGESAFLGALAYFWPLFEKLLTSRHMENSGLAIAICKSLSDAIQAGGKHFSHLLPSMMAAITSNFISFQTNICFIKLASVIIEEFGSGQQYGPLLVEALHLFTTADAVSSLNSPYKCDQEPDLAEAYMNFTSTFVRCCPEDVLAAGEIYLESALNKATICCTVLHKGAAFAAMSYISTFLDAALALTNSHSETAYGDVVLRICLHCGENIISGMLYALLGVSAMTRVHKATTVLQQLATLCDICERADWSSSLGWNLLYNWLESTVQALPSEYLSTGESDTVAASWMAAMKNAAFDFRQNEGSIQARASNGRHLQGEGGRCLKRILRDFADRHRFIASV